MGFFFLLVLEEDLFELGRLASADDDDEEEELSLFLERGAFPARLGTAYNIVVVVVFVVVVDWDDDA